MNVDTSEFRALADQVERLTVIVQDGYGPLIRTIDRLLPDDQPPAPVLRLVRRRE
jgi:hypothetical protein